MFQAFSFKNGDTTFHPRYSNPFSHYKVTYVLSQALNRFSHFGVKPRQTDNYFRNVNNSKDYLMQIEVPFLSPVVFGMWVQEATRHGCRR